MSNVDNPFNEELKKNLETFSLDQWATCHLLYYSLLYNCLRTDYKLVNRPPVVNYMKDADEVIRDFVQKTPFNKLNADLNAANVRITQAIPSVYNKPKIENIGLRSLFSSLVECIVKYCIDDFEDKSFKGYFDDIGISPKGRFSSFKAEMILRDFTKKIHEQNEREDVEQQEEETVEESFSVSTEPDPDSSEQSNSWSTSYVDLDTVSDTTKDLCKEPTSEVNFESALEETTDSDLVTYKEENSDTPLDASSAIIIESTEAKDPHSTSEESSDKLSNQNGTLVEFPLDYLSDTEETIVKSVSENFLNPTFEKNGNVQNGQSKEVILENVEAEEEHYTFRDSWEIARPLLKEMPREKILLAHIINLLICQKYLEKKRFAKYQRCLFKAVSTFKGNSNPQQKEFVLNNANQAFENLKAKIVKDIMDIPDNSLETLHGDSLFSLATDFCLELVDSTIPEDLATSLLNEASVSKDNIKSNSIIDRHVEDLFSKAQEEFSKVNMACIENDLDLLFGGKDWRTLIKNKEELEKVKEEQMYKVDEHNNDTEVLADGEEDPYPEMTELCLQNVTRLIKKLDLEQDVLVHVVALKIMTGNYPQSFYAQYKEDVKDLVSLYRKEGMSSQTKTVRKQTDETYKSISRNVTRKINRLKRGVPDPVVEGYAPIDIAAYMSLERVFKFKKGFIERAIADLTYDEKTGEYSSIETDILAAKYLKEASHEDEDGLDISILDSIWG